MNTAPNNRLPGIQTARQLLIALSGLAAVLPAIASAQDVSIVDTIPSAKNPAISGDGRFVAFESDATNLIAGQTDNNNATDVFVYDRTTKKIEMVSLNDSGQQGTASGIQGQGHSKNPSISADGRFVAFQSLANNLVPGDTNGFVNSSQGEDIFVYDRNLKRIVRISVNTISRNQGNGASVTPTISADGSIVAFSSSANNLVPGFINGNTSIYVYIRARNAVGGINLPTVSFPANLDCTNPAVSGDGKFVAFEFTVEDSAQSPSRFKYTDIYLAALSTNKVTRLTDGGDGIAAGQNNRSLAPTISDDGRFTGYHTNLKLDIDDNNNLNDVYEFDSTSPKEPIFLSFSSPATDSIVSGDGRSNAHVARGGLITRVTNQGDAAQSIVGTLPSISADGEFVAFETTTGVQVAQFPAIPGKPQNFQVKFTPKGKAQVDGSARRFFGSAKIKKKKGTLRTITITNNGSNTLRGLRMVRGGDHPRDYFARFSRKPLKPGKSVTVRLTFRPKALGSRTAELQIFSSETTDNPFDLKLIGRGRR